MRKRRWLIGLAVVVLLLVGAKIFLLDTAASPGAPYELDLAALHRVATESGPLPTSIEVERVADFAFPRTLAVAGDGFSGHKMVLLSHRVMWGDGRSIIIDTALPQADAEGLPGAEFHREAYDRMEKALPLAEQILFTHEHVDHVGGVASSPEFAAIADKVMITQQQFDGPRLERDKWAPGRLEQLKPLTYAGLRPVAPGIVLQQAPGHSIGTQLIYVELENGTKYLFVGDIAWTEDNIKLQRGRPMLVQLLGEERDKVASQLQAFTKLPKDVHIVIAHDPIAFERDLKAELFHQHFSVP